MGKKAAPAASKPASMADLFAKAGAVATKATPKAGKDDTPVVYLDVEGQSVHQGRRQSDSVADSLQEGRRRSEIVQEERRGHVLRAVGQAGLGGTEGPR